MRKQFRRALFIFRRDLRLEDNTGLIFALKNAEEVIPCFIFTPDQIVHNSYLSLHCLQFMIESLEDLEKSLNEKNAPLYLFFEKPDHLVEQCIKELDIDTVVVNRDYTPYSLSRDEKIDKVCKKSGIPFYGFDDALLHSPDETLKSNGKPYTIFTPFYKNASKLEVRPPSSNRFRNYYNRPIPFARNKDLYQKILPSRISQQTGGRTSCLKILKHLTKFAEYPSIRDFPALDGTTHLSPHLKFTTCSPREIYQELILHLGEQTELIRALYWRDFFTSIAFYFPEVFEGAFHSKFNELPWVNDKKAFKHWCEGKTGFPIIDAGMREMNHTGFMHNRVRMIAATFLIKDLHIDWRWGEKYFAQTLIDYDPAVNNGNWQWAASTGCDSVPYFRVFNPWTQGMKFDPECLYIKKWIPELSALPPKIIHEWFHEKHHEKCPDYPPPLVDHTREAKIALESYRKLVYRK